MCDRSKPHTHAPRDDRGQFRHPLAAVEVQDLMAVVATLSKGLASISGVMSTPTT